MPQWISAMIKCRMCGKVSASVYPEDILDEDCQQCPSCEHMTAAPMDLAEWEKIKRDHSGRNRDR